MALSKYTPATPSHTEPHRPTPAHTGPHRATPSHTNPEKCFKYAHQPTPTLKNALNTHTDPHRPGVSLRLT